MFRLLFVLLLSIQVFGIEKKCDTIFYKDKETIICTTYYSSGNIKRILSRSGIKPHGHLTFFYENGGLESKAFYEDGCQKDTTFEYHPDGSVKRIQPAKNCEIHGLLLVFSKEGDTLEFRKYNEGTPIGTHWYYYKKNKPQILITYDNNGRKNGPEKKWWPNGNLKEYFKRKDDEAEYIETYYENGKKRYVLEKMNLIPFREEIYEAKYFHPNGKSAGTIKNGNGTIIYYKEDASKKWKEVYKEGKQISRELIE